MTIFHNSAMIRKTKVSVWRAWRTLIVRLQCSSVSSSAGPASLDGSGNASSVSAEKPLHTPVMVKEVLHYLNIQPAQVCHFCVCHSFLCLLLNKLVNKSKQSHLDDYGPISGSSLNFVKTGDHTMW